MAEVDNLEIKIESSAKGANRSLKTMAKNLDAVAVSMEKVFRLSNGMKNIGNIDLSSLKDVNEQLKLIAETQKSVSKKKIQPKVDNKEIKESEKTLDDLFDKYSKVGKGLDLSGLGLGELEKQAKSIEKTMQRLRDRLEEKIAVEGTENLGKSWESLVFRIQKATNQAEEYREAINKLQEAAPNLHRFQDELPKSTEEDASVGKTVPIKDPSAYKYDAEAMASVYGEEARSLETYSDVVEKFGGNAQTAGKKLNEFEEKVDTKKIQTYASEIKKAKQNLAELANQGFHEGDSNYDEQARELALLIERQKEYNRANRQAAKSVIKDEQTSTLKKMSSTFKKVTGETKKFSSSFKKAISGLGKATSVIKKPIHALGKLKNAIVGLRKQSDKGMNLGKMIGSSVAFSTVFQAISLIEQAIAEGSNNLTQYSGEYNNSISSMVSSLLYLKNAWAAAFAPIANVVAPYISSFINMLSSALNKVGQFFAALTGKTVAVQSKKVWKDYGSSLKKVGSGASDASKGLDDAAKSAEKFQDYTLGIDELNIQPKTDTSTSGSGAGGSGAGGGGGTELSPQDMFETVDVASGVSEFAKKVKEAWAKADFTEIGQIIGNKLNSALESIPWESIQNTAYKVGKSVATLLNGVISPKLFGNVGTTIAESFNTAIYTALSFGQNFDFTNLGVSIATGINNFFRDFDFASLAETLNVWVDGIKDTIIGFLKTISGEEIIAGVGEFLSNLELDTIAIIAGAFALKGGAFKDLGKKFLTIGKAIKEVGTIISSTFGISSGASTAIMGGIIGALAGVILIIKDLWDTSATFRDSVTEMWEKIASAFSEAKVLIWDNTLLPLWENLKDFWNVLYDSYESSGLKALFEDVLVAIGDKISSGIVAAIKTVSNIFSTVGKVIGGLVEMLTGVIEFVTGVFTGNWDKAWSGVSKIVGGYVKGITAFFTGLWENLKIIFEPVVKFFGERFEKAYNAVKSAWSFVTQWFSDKWKGIKNVFKDVKTWFGDAFEKAYDAVTKKWEGIKKFFAKVGNWVVDPIQRAVNGVIDGINWVFEKVGADAPLKNWTDYPRFASGSNGLPRDTIGVVNDQAGSTYKELIVPPHGKPFIPEGRNVMLPMEKGTKIMPAGQTKSLMSGMPKFKKGIGDFFGNAWSKIKDFTGEVMDYIEHPSKILQIAIDKFTDFSGITKFFVPLATGAINKVFESATKFISNMFEKTGGTGIEKALRWAVGIANDNSHGYDQAHRTGPDYDCSSLVTTALKNAGFKIGIGSTSTMLGQLTSAGFKNVNGSVNKGNASGMKRGDILLTPGRHTAMYLGNGQIVHASINEFGRITGGKPGDQTGREICVKKYYNYPWSYVMRYAKGFKKGIGTIGLPDLLPKYSVGGFPEDGLFMANHNELVGKFSDGRTAVANNLDIQKGIEEAAYRGFSRANADDREEVELLRELIRAVRNGKRIVVDGRELVSVTDSRRGRNGYSFT